MHMGEKALLCRLADHLPLSHGMAFRACGRPVTAHALWLRPHGLLQGMPEAFLSWTEAGCGACRCAALYGSSESHMKLLVCVGCQVAR